MIGPVLDKRGEDDVEVYRRIAVGVYKTGEEAVVLVFSQLCFAVVIGQCASRLLRA